MRKSIFGGLTSLLIPFAAYSAQASYGAYQRKAFSRTASNSLPHSPPQLLLRESNSPVKADALTIRNGVAVRELILVDANVQGKHLILKQNKPGVDVVEIKADSDGLTALISALQGYRGLDAVHIVAHAKAGTIYLGGHKIGQQQLIDNISGFAALNHAIREGGDLMLYGCDLAQGKTGADFLQIIQNNTHIDIAASVDKTGNNSLGGNWDLEIRKGDIETQNPFSDKTLKDFSAVLSAPDGTYNFSSGWNDNGNTLGSTHFTVGAKDVNTTSLDVNIYAGSPNPAYIKNGASPNSYFYVHADGSNTATFELTALASGEYFTSQFTDMYIVGILPDNNTITSSTINGTGATGESFNFSASELANFSGVQIKGFKLYFDAVNSTDEVPDFEFRSFTIANAQDPADSDGTLTAGGGVSEPVGLDSTADTAGEAVDLFDFTLSDGGSGDGEPLTVSAATLHVSGTSTDTERAQITWRLSGPDATNVVGTYNTGSDTITFSGLNLSIADGGAETYTVNAYYNDNTGLTDGHTIVLSLDGDTDLTIDSGGTGMSGANGTVSNGTGTTIDIAATQLAFATQPAGSVSGSPLATQPAIAARDAFGNTDADFTETITLTEDGAGSLSGNTQAAVNGVATFTGLVYTATADQEAFILTADDQGGVGSNLPAVSAGTITADVVATQLLFTAQPAPTSIPSGVLTDFSSDPAVSAVDADNTLDTGYSSEITLQANGPGSAILNVTGDTDGAANTVSITPSGGISTFADMNINYTVSGSVNETFTLRATSGALSGADSSTLTAVANQPPTDITLSSPNVHQSGGADAAVGTLSSTDADAADSHSYSLVAGSGDTDNGSFNIAGDQLRANDAGALAAGAYSVRIQTQDSAGGTYEEAFTITVVDDVAPIVDSVSVPADGTYGTGQELDFTVNASENLTVTGTPRIPLTLGGSTVYADYVSGSGTSALTFRYGVQAGDSDMDGVAPGTAIQLNGGTINDAADNGLATTLNNVGATAGVLVDAVAPSGHSVSFDDDTLNDAEATSASFTFAGAEVGADYNYTIDSSGGGTPVSGSGTVASAGDQISGIDVSGLSDGTLTLAVTLTDSAGNSAGAVTDTAALDTSAPGGHSVGFDDGTLNSAEATSASFTFAGAEVGADYSYTISSSGGGTPVSGSGTVASAGDQVSGIDVSGLSDGTLTLAVTLTDSAGNTAEAVNDTAALDTSAPGGHSVSFDDGTFNSAEATSASFTFAGAEAGADYSYTISSSGGGTPVSGSGTVASAGDQVSGIDVSGLADGTLTLAATLTDSAGNTAGAVTDTTILDTQAPAVASVTLPVDDVYTADQNLDFSVNFDETVTVDTSGGTPRLALTIGTTTRHADYVSGSGTQVLLFRYTVQSGDNDSDGIALDGTLDTNGGSLRDPAGNNASNNLGTTGSLTSVLVDARGASVSSVTLPADATYGPDQNLDFTVNFDESVTVDTSGGTPRLALTIGTTTRYADYVSGSGTQALLFRYIVQNGDNDSDGIALDGTLDTNGGSLRDSAGNDVDSDLGTIGSLASVLVDAQAASVTSVTLPPDNIYHLGENLNFIVHYDEAVAVTGTPRLELTIGTSTRYATYTDGSGSNALLFRHAVQDGDSDGDGIELSVTLDNNGGTLQDATGNDADTHLGAIGSLTGVLVGALDTDGDGVSDVQEGIDGTDPSDPDDYFDTAPPVVVAPADLVIDASGLFTPVTERRLLGLAVDATEEQLQNARDSLAEDDVDGANCCDTRAGFIASNGGSPQVIDSDPLRLAPGLHVIAWRGEDRKGNAGSDTQMVRIRPLASVGKDQIGVEGGPVSLRIYLNGLSDTYPLEVPYRVDTSATSDASDHDLVDGRVTFASGETQQSVTVNLAGGDATEGDETLVVDLDAATVNTGPQAQHRITIREGNVAPDIALTMQQNAMDTALVVTGGGEVQVTAGVSDLNTANTHSYDWSGTSMPLADTDGDPANDTFVFSPDTLAPGVYTMRVFVTDNHGASDTALLNFRAVAEAPVLDTSDSDGDGIDDQSEGFGDSDGDGIPDYRDNIAASNVLPLAAAITDAYLIECDPGVRCRLGRYALAGSDGGAGITEDALPADDGFHHAGGLFDFEVHDLPVPGQTVRVAIPLIEAIPANAVYRKFDGRQWFTFVEDGRNALHSSAGAAGFCPPPGDTAWQPGLVQGFHCVQLTLEDGGANDSDGLANGSVEDPGGLATADTSSGSSSSSSSSSSGSSSSGSSSSGSSSSGSSSSGSSSSSSSSGGTGQVTTRSISGKTKGGALGLPFSLALLLSALWRSRRRVARLCALTAALFTPWSQAQGSGLPTGGDIDKPEHHPQNLVDALAENGYLAIDLYKATGDQQRGDFVGAMASDGVEVSVRHYDVRRSAYQLSLGYHYRADMAVELGYLDLGEVNFALDATATDEAAMTDALADHLPLSGDGWTLANRFDFVFGQWRTSAGVGVYFWESEASIDAPAINPRMEDDTVPLLGLGAAYTLSERLEVGLQYRRVFFDTQDVTLWGGRIAWRL